MMVSFVQLQEFNDSQICFCSVMVGFITSRDLNDGKFCSF